MKLKKIIVKYGYLMVMGLCLACSAVLLVSVVTDRPLVAAVRTHVPVLRTQAAAGTGHDPEALAEAARTAPTGQGETGAAGTDAPGSAPAGETATATPDQAAEAPVPAEEPGQEVLSGTGTGYVLTEDYLEEQLAGFLPESFPVRDLDVSFDGGVLSLSADMSRAALKSYLKERGVELGMKRNLLLQMLPRELEVELVFALSADEQGLHLTPVTFVAGDKALSLSGLPQDTFSAIDAGLNALLEQAGVSFSSAEFVEDGLLLK